jgi:hypothetical protein
MYRAAQLAPPGEARAEDRGLGVGGAVIDAREGVLADDVGGELEQIWRTRAT